MSDCTFCEIINGNKEDYVIWQNQKFIALLDNDPISPEHFLLIPKEHVDYFFDMNDKLSQELLMTA